MTSLHSPRWHRVAELRPRLAPQLRVQRQLLRGERWVLLLDAQGQRCLRLNAAGHAFAGRLDGRRTMQQLWELLQALPGEPPTQDELIDILARLGENGLAQTDRPADFARLLAHRDTLARPRGSRSLLAWRIPLADPSRLLDRLAWAQQALFSRTAWWLWLLAMALLAGLVLLHAQALWAHGRLWLDTPRFGLLALALYVPIKLVHELAHGLAVRRWGGPVHEAGITLMMGLPVPYVDASAATGFAQRRQRLAVGAAGIMAELSLAAVALPMWLVLDEGWPRDIAFVTLFITGISTLLFNANPLQRLDGYFMLCDALELPNLGPRSRQWWLDLLLRRALRMPGAEAMPVARGEAPWLAAYAPLAWLYGLLVVALAVLWLGALSLTLGLLCGALLGWQLLLAPPLRLLQQLYRAAMGQAATARRWRRLALAGVAAMAVALLLPLPQHTLVQAVVWPSDQAQLRSGEDGFVMSIEAADGSLVLPGQVVLRLANPQLQADLLRQQARVAALEAEGVQASAEPRAPPGSTRSGDNRAERVAGQAALERLVERVQALEVRAQAAGRLALPQADDLDARFVRRGQLLGRVLTDEPLRVRAALPESEFAELDELAALRRSPQGISVRLAAAPARAYAGTLLGDGGGAVLQLPSAALSQRHGGSVATDPRDSDDLRPLRPVVLLDVRLQGPATGSGERSAEKSAEESVERIGEPGAERIGERAWVRFDGGLAPAGWQAARALQRMLQRHFNPQF